MNLYMSSGAFSDFQGFQKQKLSELVNFYNVNGDYIKYHCITFDITFDPIAKGKKSMIMFI